MWRQLKRDPGVRCHLSEDTPPQLLTGAGFTMRYSGGRLWGGGGGRDKGPEAENRPVRVSVWGVKPCPVLAFQAAVRLREEIRALKGVFILNMVLHSFSG